MVADAHLGGGGAAKEGRREPKEGLHHDGVRGEGLLTQAGGEQADSGKAELLKQRDATSSCGSGLGSG